jgi:hypothetical protein
MIYLLKFWNSELLVEGPEDFPDVELSLVLESGKFASLNDMFVEELLNKGFKQLNHKVIYVK